MTLQTDELKKTIVYFQYTNARILEQLVAANKILQQIGFENGIETVKEAAKEIIRIKKNAGRDDSERH